MKRNADICFFWRSFCMEYFSDKFAKIWAKILRTPKNLPAPTPMHKKVQYFIEFVVAIC